MGDFGVTHRVHLWLDGKHVVDFLLAIIEFLSLALTAAALFSEICGNRRFLPYDSTGTRFLMPKFVGGGRPFPPEICVQSDPPPFLTAKFRPISAHSASAVIASEKSSIITYRKSTTRFPTSHR